MTLLNLSQEKPQIITLGILAESSTYHWPEELPHPSPHPAGRRRQAPDGPSRENEAGIKNVKVQALRNG